MQVKLAISTCPNDTFMFEALINKRIELKGYSFDLHMADIEDLNKQAINQQVDISKISFNSYIHLSKYYQILRSGAAIGFANGPLFISKRKINVEEIPTIKVAIPGENTTANLLLKTIFPNIQNKQTYLFSDIEEAILQGEVDAGVIIHETRFSYQKHGLQLVADLGNEWELFKKLPLPLGGIVIKRNLPESTKKEIQEIITQSVQYALNNPKESFSFVKKHAQNLDNDVINKHIQMYVNEMSTNINQLGENAIQEILTISSQLENKLLTDPIFI